MATLNKNAILTLEQLKAELRSSPFVPDKLDLDDEDVEAHLIQQINIASAQVESIIGRELALQEYTEKVSTSANPVLNLDNFPIKEVKELHIINGYEISEYKLDSSMIKKFNSKRDLDRGSIYMEPIMLPRQLRVGIGRHPFQTLRNLAVTYDAGYVMPGDATEDNPSDLPADIVGVVMSAVTRDFRKHIDPTRSDDLIQLQEGNVNRMWGTGVAKELVKQGMFEVNEIKILHRYRAARKVYSV